MSEQVVLEFTADDFIRSAKPYEYLYGLKDPFVRSREVDRLARAAKALGVIQTFRSLWKGYQISVNPSRQTAMIANVTEFPGQPVSLKCGEYVCDEFGVHIEGPRGSITVCAHPVMPVRRIINLDSEECKTEIAFLRGKSWRRVIVENRVLSSAQRIVELSSYGISVSSESAKYLVTYIGDIVEENYDELPEEKSIGRLGWVAGYGFSPYVGGLSFDGAEQYRHAFAAVRAAGSFDAWKALILRVRSGPSVAARIMLAASFASVLVGPLNALPFIVHCWSNTSGIGKTVALMMAGSVWADPRQGEYLKTYNSTSVGIEMMAGFYGSLPLCMDELCLRNNRRDAFDDMIYQYCEGVGRTRGAKQGGLQPLKSWRNCMISTGEEPLVSGSSKAGAVNRVLDVNAGSTKMFDDPREAVRILTANYGHAGKMFVDTLDSGGGINAVQVMQEAYLQQMDGKITDKQRLSASILLAADAWAEAVIFGDGRALTADEIIPYLQTSASTDVNVRAYDYLMDTVSANPARFSDAENTGERWGEIDGEKGLVYIIKSVFDRIMQDEGYNSTGFLAWAKQQKLLRTDGGLNDPRLTKRKRLRGMDVPARCVCIQVPDENCDRSTGYTIVPDEQVMFDEVR